MRNPWLDIPLDDYERHMALPQVGQAELLADLFSESVNRPALTSVAIIGCSGGNGLERLEHPTTLRVVAVDLNRRYAEKLRERFASSVPNLEIIVGDIQSPDVRFKPVELIFAGLVLEYVDVSRTLGRLRDLLEPSGRLVTVIQLASATVPEVTPTPFQSLNSLSSIMNLVTPSTVRAIAEQNGFREVSARVVSPRGDELARKQFAVQEFQWNR